MNKFLNLLQFLTRITVSKNLKYNEEMGSSMMYFPMVGMVIGLIITITAFILKMIVGFEKIHLLIAAIIVMEEVVITGGLHIDGFGDTFDGLFSYRSKERVLEIMKDPTMGTNGILAIVFLIVFKVIAVDIAIEKDILWALFSMPAVARFAPVIMSYRAVSARKNGMGELFIGKCDKKNLFAAFIFSLLSVAIPSFLHYRNIEISLIYSFSILLIALYSRLFRKSVYRQIDGITGDILGCSTEMSELIFIIYVVIISQWIA